MFNQFSKFANLCIMGGHSDQIKNSSCEAVYIIIWPNITTFFKRHFKPLVGVVQMRSILCPQIHFEVSPTVHLRMIQSDSNLETLRSQATNLHHPSLLFITILDTMTHTYTM